MKIDGSYGEGGGQILRTAVALSCITGEKVEVHSIRKGRKVPGLKPQHLAGIKLAARMCNADVSGARVGSTELAFAPEEVKGGDYTVDIGTAGSITLLLQTILPVTISSGKDFTFTIRGGTDVRFAPLIDYYAHVLFPLLKMHGVNVDIETIQRGYYPEGGGVVRVSISEGKLGEMLIDERGTPGGREVRFNSRNLPEHIGRRIHKVLWNFGEFHSDAKMGGPSRGCGLVLLQKFENTVMGADELCKKGVPAEKVAMNALKKFKGEINSRGTVDSHMADHLPVFAFASGRVRYIPSTMTEHTRTNLWLVEKFGAEVKVNNYVEVRTHAYI